MFTPFDHLKGHRTRRHVLKLIKCSVTKSKQKFTNIDVCHQYIAENLLTWEGEGELGCSRTEMSSWSTTYTDTRHVTVKQHVHHVI